MPWWLLLIPLGSALFGSVFYIIGRVNGIPGSKHWPRMQGVTFAEPRDWFSQRARQRYRGSGPDGRVREGQSPYTNQQIKEGTRVTVLYDPQDFDKFRLAGIVQSGLLFKLVGLLIFGIGVVAMMIIGTSLGVPSPVPSA